MWKGFRDSFAGPEKTIILISLLDILAVFVVLVMTAEVEFSGSSPFLRLWIHTNSMFLVGPLFLMAKLCRERSFLQFIFVCLKLQKQLTALTVIAWIYNVYLKFYAIFLFKIT